MKALAYWLCLVPLVALGQAADPSGGGSDKCTGAACSVVSLTTTTGSVVAGSTLANKATLAGSTTGNAVTLAASGSDTNIGVTITGKGSGSITLGAGLTVEPTVGNIATNGTITASGSGATIRSTATNQPFLANNVSTGSDGLVINNAVDTAFAVRMVGSGEARIKSDAGGRFISIAGGVGTSNDATFSGGTAVIAAATRATSAQNSGSIGLTSGTPSTATVTVQSGAKCVCVETTTAANNGNLKCVVSGTTLTITGPNAVTDTIAYLCF